MLRGVPFVAVPYDLLVDERLSAGAVRVWAAIASHLMPNGKGVFPGQERLAAMCRCSVPTVQRAISDLKQTGWLTCEQGRKRDGNLGTNRYTLCYRPAITDDARSSITDDAPPAITGEGPEVDEALVSRDGRPNGLHRATTSVVASGNGDGDLQDLLEDLGGDQGIPW